MEQRSALKEHVQSVGPAINYKKAEQVWDSYYKTMYTLKSVAADIRATKEVAAEVIKKVRGRGRGGGVILNGRWGTVTVVIGSLQS